MSSEEKKSAVSIKAKFESLSMRHRVMTLTLISVVILVLFDFFWFQPLMKSNEKGERKLTSVQEERQQLSDKMIELQSSLGRTDFKEKKKQLSNLKQQAKSLDDSLAQYAHLVAPNEVPELLRKVFRNSEKLKLIELKKDNVLPAFPYEQNEDAEQETASTPPNLYKHGFSITLNGRYFDLLEALIKLENIGLKVYWESMEYSVKDHPNAQARISVYTYSYHQDWIGV